MKSPLQSYLDSLHARLRENRAGAVASYIPELTRVDADAYGISLVTMDGVHYGVGDCEHPFTIQSISKAFVYAAALEDRGRDAVMRKIGVEPSGDAFNSISLDPQTGAPKNPMINAGAIAATSLVAGADAGAQWARIQHAIEGFLGHPLQVDESVYRSESETGHRNRAIAWMLKNFDIVEGDAMASLENYFRQCSILVTCRDLATMAATLANGGMHPLTGQRALQAEQVDRVLSVMATCGMYDYAGSWLYEVGIPAKSGVGGGIIAVLPGRFGIGVYSPRLDVKGNSVRGIETCKALARDFGINVFSRAGDPRKAIGRVYTAADAPSRRQPVGKMREYLNAQAHRIKYLCLHGYLNVDSVEYIVRRLQELAPDTSSFILDMNQVPGISEAAARMLNLARVELGRGDVAVVFSRIYGNQSVIEPLAKAVPGDARGFLSFEDNDLAAEWCENRLCAALPAVTELPVSLADLSLFRGMPVELMTRIEALARRQSFAQGDQILRAGQEDDHRIFCIERGQVSIVVATAHGGHQRIASLGAGMNFGEMVLLGQTTRSASVFADSAVDCLVLDALELERLEREDPQLKIVLLDNLARDMAAALRRATNWIAALA